ncbi:hypothetical protein KUTeg_000574 [Tegillarca granosa]|uniref:Uncharacterized protein n=1 Tax=Tegillarca granosa TaxID=220873 RepID=A0ABQ9FXX3_TEGGR|nr:hypothetical protein KUTeg_000574 [Tegillarca granosa]
MNELDRELKNFLNRRDDGATQTQDAVHACEQGMTDEIKNKMKNRFESQNGVLDLETGFTHVLHFLGSLGVVAHTPRDPKEANAIMKIAVDEVTGYLSENFPPPQDVNVPSKRGDTLPQGTEQDMALEGIFHVICSFNRQSWKQVVTDFDQVIDEGLWVVRNTSSLLRSIRVIVALEGGDDAKIKKAFDHAQAIRERVEKAIAAYLTDRKSVISENSQNTDQSGGSKRVLHGLSKDG